MLKSVPNVIPSIQVSRKQQQHAAVLRDSTESTVLNRNNGMSKAGVEVEKSQPILILRIKGQNLFVKVR